MNLGAFCGVFMVFFMVCGDFLGIKDGLDVIVLGCFLGMIGFIVVGASVLDLDEW